MAEILAQVYRGKREEATHYGSVAVVDKDGHLTHYVGNPQYFTFVRSSIKPFQLIPTVASGAADHFGFSPRQLAVMCGSHIGTDAHRETVTANLKAAGNSAENLRCGTHVPIFMTMKNEFPRHDEEKDPLRHNCSGKHSGFLALTRFLGGDIAEYLNPASKTQQLVLEAVSSVYEYPKEKMATGIDGCSAPNFGLPLIHTAIAFQKLAAARGKDNMESAVLRRIRDAMMAFPEMVSGEGRFDLALSRTFANDLVCKVGAESIQGIGLIDPPIGIVVKIDDGNQRALYPVVVDVLRQLGLVDIDRAELLQPFYRAEIRNNRHTLTGMVRAEFTLKKA